MNTETLKCPRCGAEMVYNAKDNTMFCPSCGYEVNAKFTKNFQIEKRDLKDKNLPMGKKFEIGTFL